MKISRNKISNCPKCASPKVYRSRRRGLAELFLHRVLFISPYRCYDCDDRHFRFTLSESKVRRTFSGRSDLKTLRP